MSKFSFATSRRWLITLVIAAVLAVTATYAPVVLDGAAGTATTPAVWACSHTGGGC
jgi:hypothetical protein